MKRVGIYSGSFNPIHIGHLALANYLCEFSYVDEVWFVVTPHNPLKDQKGLLKDSERLKLVKLATEGYPKFVASDFEFDLPKPSYSIHTLEKLHEEYPQTEFHLIIGADNWSSFSLWKDSEKILENYNLLVYPRKGFDINPSELPKNVILAETPLFEISSTFIREAIAQNKDIRYFLQDKVYQYIKQAKLYR